MTSSNGAQYWQVAVNAPLKDPFTYKAPADWNLMPGCSVTVPFGSRNRKATGLLLESVPEPASTEFEIKEILSIEEERPSLSSQQIRWLQWLADYYIHPLGQIQELVFPPLSKKGGRGSKKNNVIPQVALVEPHPLTSEQEHVLSQINLNQYNSYLLHGVTGSGKTEVYIEVISKALQQGSTALVLVPEISLTPQLIRRFAERFPNQIAVLHSQLTEREKTEQWWNVVDGERRLLIGARSALFCPLPKLGVIVVDEEHETSFKQEEKLKYNARDAAVVRGQLEGCPVILGSATPSLETWANTLNGKYQKLSMPHRVSNRPLPTVEIVNPQKQEEAKLKNLPYWLSSELFDHLQRNYQQGLQSALFLNRRGMAPTVQCYDCGFIYMCPNCDISLTLHGHNHLVCHYCNYHDRNRGHCPQCADGETKAYGLGTEAVEIDLQKLFPDARIMRADRDEIQSREAIEDLVQKMEKHEVDFLVGTQMIAKGLDFKNLTVVGIVLADIAFNIPDFRASERSFQLCTQVSGRAGRHEHPGAVVIQTYKPDHHSLVTAAQHDYVRFVNQELQHRELFKYPPFGKLTAIRLSATREDELLQESQQLTNYLKDLIQKFPALQAAQILGPTPAPLSRIKNRYRYHILLKAPDFKIVHFIGHKAADFMKSHFKKTKGSIDVDPYTLI